VESWSVLTFPAVNALPVPLVVRPLQRSEDRKTTPLARRDSGKYRVAIANSHGLPAGVSCPERTTVCAGSSAALSTDELEALQSRALAESAGRRGRTTTWKVVLNDAGLSDDWPCYVVQNMTRGTEENVCWRNWEYLRPLLNDADSLRAVFDATFDEFLSECDRRSVAPIYRIHWDGDIPTAAYARALRESVQAHPTLRAWIYTRTLSTVPLLVGCPNLAVYVSTDSDNVEMVRDLLVAYPDLHVAALGQDADSSAAVLARVGRRPAPVCPVDSGKTPLVVSMDRRRAPTIGESGQGACAACGLCIYGRKDVRFTISRSKPRPVTLA
jgi:hypothetical protein